MEMIESSTFRKWMAALADETGKAHIVARLSRLMAGLPGDIKTIGAGISELRIHYGPGYRVYFHKRGNRLVVLLCAGAKGSQPRDIVAARQLLHSWRCEHD